MATLMFAGRSNPSLATAITQQGRAFQDRIVLAGCQISRFSDGEIRAEIEQTVRGRKVFILQSTCAPVNDNLMEMLVLADALRRSAVKRIVAVIPYYGYGRQDRRPGYSRVPISARLVADMIETAGINHVITVDLHATQIQGFFRIPVDNISATQLFVADIYKKWSGEDLVVVSPDSGGVARARSVAKHLDNADLAIVDKRRPKANESQVMNIIGNVDGKTCVMVDDLADTAGTLAKAANALIEVGGAKRVVAYASHGVLSGNAKQNLADSKLTELVVTDTIPRPVDMVGFDKVRYISIAGLLAETIERVDHKQSVSQFLD